MFIFKFVFCFNLEILRPFLSVTALFCPLVKLEPILRAFTIYGSFSDATSLC